MFLSFSQKETDYPAAATTPHGDRQLPLACHSDKRIFIEHSSVFHYLPARTIFMRTCAHRAAQRGTVGS
jgi:hypothetical protein